MGISWRWASIALFLSTPALAAEDPVIPLPDLQFSTAPATVNVSTYVWRTISNTAFQAGEHLTFAIKWSGMTGGYADMSIEGPEKLGARTAYRLVSNAHSTGVVQAFYRVLDRQDIWIDTQSLTTLRYDKRISEGKYRVEQHTILDQPSGRYAMNAYRFDRKTYEKSEGVIPPHTLDSFGALYYIRTLPLEVGKSYIVDVLSTDKIYPLIVNVKKREKIKVAAGRFDCFLVEPQLRSNDVFVAKGKKLEVWLTTDPRHMPVRMRSEVFIGHVSAELVKDPSSGSPN